MAKTKTPFFSMGSRGSIGKQITTQAHSDSTLVRVKPIPDYRLTLPQQYQRWLYYDYAYLWGKQSEATRRAYAADGVKFHLTGFQYWMKYHLKYMPDIIGIWHMDEKAGALVYDSSVHAHHGVLDGPTPISALIDGGLSFDNINDNIAVYGIPPPQLTALTVLCFTRPHAFSGDYDTLIHWNLYAAPWGFQILKHLTRNTFKSWIKNTAGTIKDREVSFTPEEWLLAGLLWTGSTFYGIANAKVTPGTPFSGVVNPNASLYFGVTGAGAPPRWYDSPQDNMIIYRRALDDTEIARWAERRYAPQ